MKPEDFINITMSLGRDIEEKDVIRMRKTKGKTNPDDWSCAFVNDSLEQIGLEGTWLDIPESFLNIGVSTKEYSLGDIVIFTNKEHSQVGFFQKTVDLAPSLDFPDNMEDDGKAQKGLRLITTLSGKPRTTVLDILLSSVIDVRNLNCKKVPALDLEYKT